MYRVEVDWAPPYELLVSLNAFVEKTSHKTLELGPNWAKSVRTQLCPEFVAELSARGSLQGMHLVDLLIHQCPGERDPASFLTWLASRSQGDLYECLAPYVAGRHSESLQDLGALQDRAVRLLTAWNQQYFRNVDGAILDGLRANAEGKQSLVSTLNPEELVEVATSGVRFLPSDDLDVVLLIPQYHFRPWNLHDTFRRMRLVSYPADVLPTAPGEPSPRLMRLVRALSDESRLRILRLLAQGPGSFTDVVRATGLSKSTVNHHMVALRAAGLVRVHDPGERMLIYILREDAIDEMGDRLREFLSYES